MTSVLPGATGVAPDAASADVPYNSNALNSKDTAALLQWVLSQYSQCRTGRSLQERQWYMNMAFFFGKQNVQMMTTAAGTNGFRLYTPPAPPWRVRLVINKIRPIIRTELAKLYSQKPRFTVVPATTEDEDLSSARAAEQILDATYEEKEIQSVLRQAGWWASICGDGFIKDYWDKNRHYSDGSAGDICIEAVTPFHIFVPDLRAISIEDQPYVIHATTQTPDWVRSRFPDVVKNAPGSLENVKATDDILEDAFLNMVGAKTAQKDKVLVLECWLKPKSHPKFPDGGLVIVVGGQVAHVEQKYPYKHGEFPFTKISRIPSGKFYSTSVIEDLVPIQREYNRTRSQIIENKNLMGKVKLMAPRGSIEPQKITSEPGQAILYTPGFNPPTVVTPSPLPDYILNEVQQLQQDFDDISGQHEISRGQNPSQVTSATALSYLGERDDTMLSDGTESVEQGVKRLGRHILFYATQYWTTGRLVRTVGTDDAFDAQVFAARDIKGNHDVRVEAGSALPKSKAAKQAFLMDLMKMSVIQPQTGLEMLDLGGIEKAYEDVLTDKRQAQRENTRLSQGENFLSNDYDNHLLHIAVHDKYRKSQQFEILPDELKVLFNDHVNAHKKAAGLPVNEPGMPLQGPENDDTPLAPPPGSQPPPGNGPAPVGMPGGGPPPDASMMPPQPGGM